MNSSGRTEWETVIGLETHVQLLTKSKIFSGASTDYGAAPNTQACAIDLGLPGVLPVLNEAVVRMAVKFGIAVNAEIAPRSIFARKNYFYPDLPKGYQISQYDHPIVGRGGLEITLEDNSRKVIGITRAHLEEDAGKSLHEDFHGLTGIDLNRAGIPLLEVVTDPDMRSAAEAVAYAKKLHTLVRYIEICNGNMQEGAFRCDANVSVRPRGSETLGTRTELKNLNSFRFIEQAIEFEIDRQIELLESGGKVIQETRLYDPERHETRSMRSKEEDHDYRYFPDPDLLPVKLDDAFIEEVRAAMPELPDEKRARFMRRFGLSFEEAGELTVTRELADYFERCTGVPGADPRLAANWVRGEMLGALNKEGLTVEASPVSAEMLGGLIRRMSDGTISGKIAKQVFEVMWHSKGNADQIIESKGLKQITDASELEQVVEQVVAAHPDQVEQYRGGKDKLIGFFVGQVMKATQGKANPEQVNRLLAEKLK